jgi:hypothetical protein
MEHTRSNIGKNVVLSTWIEPQRLKPLLTVETCGAPNGLSVQSDGGLGLQQGEVLKSKQSKFRIVSWSLGRDGMEC